MSSLDLTGYDLLRSAAVAVAWMAVGVGVAAAYFLTLRENVRMFAVGRSLLLTLAIQLLRFLLMTAALTAIARFSGASALLAATAGLVAMRTAIVRWGAQP